MSLGEQALRALGAGRVDRDNANGRGVWRRFMVLGAGCIAILAASGGCAETDRASRSQGTEPPVLAGGDGGAAKPAAAGGTGGSAGDSAKATESADPSASTARANGGEGGDGRGGRSSGLVAGGSGGTTPAGGGSPEGSGTGGGGSPRSGDAGGGGAPQSADAGTGGGPPQASGGRPGAGMLCSYDGTFYRDGSTFRSQDGCSACRCETTAVTCDAPDPECTPCSSAAQCSGDEYCKIAGLSCDGPGVCSALPTSCEDAVDSEVCGCDGTTYANFCEAARAGVNVAAHAPCATATGCELDGKVYPEGTNGVLIGCVFCECEFSAGSTWICPQQLCDPCGGENDLECGMNPGYDDYCFYPASDACGESQALGECYLKPAECAAEGPAVCGCDDVTYANRCVAAAAGQSVRSEGSCD